MLSEALFELADSLSAEGRPFADVAEGSESSDPDSGDFAALRILDSLAAT